MMILINKNEQNNQASDLPKEEELVETSEQVTENKPPWYKKYQNHIIIGIVALVVIVAGIFVFLNLRTDVTKQESGEAQVFESDRKLLIVTEPWPPFTFEEDGIIKGIHADIVKLVMKKLDLPYEIRIMPWARALKMVETGEADVLLSGSYTDERDEWAYFTEDQRLAKNEVLPEFFLDKLDMVFFIRKPFKDAIIFESFDQIKESDYKVGLDAGYAYRDTVLQAGWDTEYSPTTADSMQALFEGKTDMYLQDKIVGLQLIKELGLEDEIIYIDKPALTFVYHWPFSKNSDYPNLKEIWKQSLVEVGEIYKNGEYDEIYSKYIRE